MADRPPSRFWRTSRRIFRWTRITVWLLVLALLGSLVYLNRVGLPDFLKRRLVAELEARGVELQFVRLRLHWYRGIVAERVSFGSAGLAPGVGLYADEVELRPDWAALKRLHLQIRGLGLRGGRFEWSTPPAGGTAHAVVVDDINTEVRFLPDDQWQLERFVASYGGARLRVTGTITNASALGAWRQKPAAPGEAAELHEQANLLLDTFEQIHFASPPELNLLFTGDARDPQSFRGLVTVRAPAADSPWASVTNFSLNARLTPAVAPHQLPLATLNLKAGDARSRWATTRDLDLTLDFAGAESQTNILHGRLELSAGTSSTPWGDAGRTHLNVRWTQSLTNPIPLDAEADARLNRVRTPWGTADTARLVVQRRPTPADFAARASEDWGWWAQLEPFQLAVHAELAGVEARNLAVREVVADARWQAPEVTVTNLLVRLYDGQLAAQAGVDVATRAATIQARADFDAHRLEPALPEPAVNWLRQFTYERPPQLRASGSGILPVWTNRPPEWWTQMQPTLRVEGEFDSGPGAYRGVQVTAARGHLIYSNRCLYLPDLHITRPEGEARLAHRADETTHEIYWRIDARLDPNLLRPIAGAGLGRALDLFQFSSPPHIDGEVWAVSHVPTPQLVTGRVTLTNFTFRGEAFAGVQTALRFTNQVIEFHQPEVVRTDGVARAELVRVDLAADRLFLTNGYSTTDPMVVMRAIGPPTAKAIAPYQFQRPPEGRVNGWVPLHGADGFDLHVALAGGPFRWGPFNLGAITGAVHYVDQTVTLSGVEASAYSGQLAGSARFNLRPGRGDQFRFDLAVTNANLQQLMRDLSQRTNRLEGVFSGHLNVTDANSADVETWQGFGDVALHDGLLWELPLFGLFSPVLNGIVPGLGNSRFSRGACTFTITNSVIHSEDMELRAPLLRMKCRGTADFHERINARVEAEPLRNTWIIGPLLSTVLWPVTKALEYKVTGTLDQPKAEPLYGPAKLLLFPLQPITTLKNLFGDDAGKTNPPPAQPGP